MTRPYLQLYRHDLRNAAEREIDTSQAEHAPPRPPRKRRLVEGKQTYTAWDAHRLLEAESDGILARPGHPVG